MHQSQPNPFQEKVEINYTLKESTMLKVAIYNQLGELVRLLFEGRQTVGKHSLNWQADGLNSGVYIYKISTSDIEIGGKMVFLK